MKARRREVPADYADILAEPLPDRDDIRRRIEETVRRLQEVLGDVQAPGLSNEPPESRVNAGAPERV